MPSPEHLYRQRKLFAPVDKTGGFSNGPADIEGSQQDTASTNPLAGTEQLAPTPTGSPVTEDPANADSALDAPTDSDRQNELSGQRQDATHLTGTEGTQSVKKQFIWTEDLSENGKKLYLLLQGDVGFVKYLPELAQMEGIELNAGLEELRSWNVLDESDPAMIRLKWKSEAGL